LTDTKVDMYCYKILIFLLDLRQHHDLSQNLYKVCSIDITAGFIVLCLQHNGMNHLQNDESY